VGFVENIERAGRSGGARVLCELDALRLRRRKRRSTIGELDVTSPTSTGVSSFCRICGMFSRIFSASAIACRATRNRVAFVAPARVSAYVPAPAADFARHVHIGKKFISIAEARRLARFAAPAFHVELTARAVSALPAIRAAWRNSSRMGAKTPV